jgi:pilus assembly protein Flp/PilA
MLRNIWKLVSDENGQSLVEYGLIIALIAIVLVGVLSLLSGSLSNVFSNITDELNDLPGASGTE